MDLWHLWHGNFHLFTCIAAHTDTEYFTHNTALTATWPATHDSPLYFYILIVFSVTDLH